jgi:hypothetical protein
MGTTLCTAAIAAAATMLVAGCGDEDRNAAEQVSFASHDPGANVAPTHDRSFLLLSVDGPTRLANLQMLVTESGNQCSFVTSGRLIGALDGTDEWRVKCADSGTWAVWLKPGAGVDVVRCSTADCL